MKSKNKIFLSLIISGIILLGISFYLYAATETPNPGHGLSSINPPENCQVSPEPTGGYLLVWKNGAWNCVTNPSFQMNYGTLKYEGMLFVNLPGSTIPSGGNAVVTGYSNDKNIPGIGGSNTIDGGIGVAGRSPGSAVVGVNSNNFNYGALGTPDTGVYGISNGNEGKLGTPSTAVYGLAGSTSNYAGYFNGKIRIINFGPYQSGTKYHLCVDSLGIIYQGTTTGC